jgi:hypothetical protein
MHSAKKRKSAPPTHARGDDSSGRRFSHRDDRRPRRRRAYLICALAALGVLGSALVFVKGGETDASSRTSSASPLPSAPHIPATTVPATTPSSPSSPHATTHKPTAAADGNGKSGGSTASPTKGPASGPASGNGTFTTADASGRPAGTGRIRRYKVQVEQGAGVSAEDAAHEISGILADPRSWTADGHDAFKLVASGPYDFEIKIATPGTVDRICGAAGLHTHGEVNCDVGDQVIVNLKRWNTGSPEFPGPISDYRALIINHEVGHRIGHGHEGCPGPGRPAPAMMQQIDGLHGCVANAWPYDAHGHYLAGPPVP